ncbi:MAG: hypothetical protein A2Z52_01680 [Candidatus Moranbacteria bacterium RBG_19FT_COMBO_42_6]|nr:MAG: hypothetical protein A2Z52_01680 [Candidatus Moranbacteria bacterium RBG_19FT_COMBO_42_6]
MSFERLEKSDALKKAEREDAELSAKLSTKREAEPFPGPPTVSPEIAEENLEILESRPAEPTGELGRLIQFPEKRKPEGPKKKKAA